MKIGNGKKLLAPVLALALLLALCPRPLAADAANTRDNGQPYYIMVNRTMNTVTIYGLDESGYYRKSVKAMICSTGREGHSTPLGTYSITGVKKAWCLMVDGSYGQYSSQFNGSILFHSVCYTEPDPATLMTEEYNLLGSVASRGCVRLQVADAKWIYENCGAGTKVTVYESSAPGPLGKPAPLVEKITAELDNGWEPTDPREDNPWRERLAQTPEEEAPLSFDDVASGAWYYGDVRYVHQRGLMGETAPRTFSPSAPADAATALRALYRLSGGLSENRGDWLAWAVRNGIADEDFDPERALTRQDLAVLLYRYETGCLGRHASGYTLLSAFSDGGTVREGAKTAMRWAVGNGLIQGTADKLLSPSASLSRGQLAAVLHRYGLLERTA